MALQARVRELEARGSQNASNSSHPPSSGPPHAPPNRRAVPARRNRVGNPDVVVLLAVAVPIGLGCIIAAMELWAGEEYRAERNSEAP